jgi:hypothetical protein
MLLLRLGVLGQSSTWATPGVGVLTLVTDVIERTPEGLVPVRSLQLRPRRLRIGATR